MYEYTIKNKQHREGLYVDNRNQAHNTTISPL